MYAYEVAHQRLVDPMYADSLPRQPMGKVGDTVQIETNRRVGVSTLDQVTVIGIDVRTQYALLDPDLIGSLPR
jgi:hypothetical protein